MDYYQNLNAAHDIRHKLERSVAVPEEKQLAVVRCTTCLRLATDPECRVFGMCPRCHGHKFTGAYPAWYEMPRIFLLNITQHWRVHGEKGWGWKRALQRRNGR